MSKKEKGTYYPDISSEFEMARINYGLFERDDGRKMTLKEFEPMSSPSMISNAASGRASVATLRKRIEKFTRQWYWEFDKKTVKKEES